MKVPIEALNTPNIYHFPQFATGVEVRVYADSPFMTYNGQKIPAGRPNTANSWYLPVPCEVQAGNILYVPGFELDSTEDSPTNRSATYTAWLFSNGSRVGTVPFLAGFAVPASIDPLTLLAANQTWGGLELHRDARNPPPRQGVYDIGQVEYLITQALAELRFASTTQVGMAAGTMDPVDPGYPIHVSDNDPRVPTTDQSLALLGTFGTPSNTNRFVTDSDPRISSVKNFGAIGDGVADDTAAIQAAITTVLVIGGGKLYFPAGLYKITSTIIVGDLAGGAFQSINLQGDGVVNTHLIWAGSTSGTMFKFWRNKYANTTGIKFLNSVAMGTTIGLHLTGPASGLQSNNLNFNNCDFQGFSIGVQAGGGVLGSEAAAELDFLNCNFTLNDIGFNGAGTGNTLNIWFRGCMFVQNTSYGVYAGTAGAVHFSGGGSNNNGIATIFFFGGWTVSPSVSGMRFELDGAGGELAVQGGNPNTLLVEGCHFLTTSTVPTYPVIQTASQVTLLNNVFGTGADVGWITAGIATGGNPQNYSLTMMGNDVFGTEPFYVDAGSQNDGLRYFMQGNFIRGHVNPRLNRSGQVVGAAMVDSTTPLALPDSIALRDADGGIAFSGITVTSPTDPTLFNANRADDRVNIGSISTVERYKLNVIYELDEITNPSQGGFAITSRVDLQAPSGICLLNAKGVYGTLWTTGAATFNAQLSAVAGNAYMIAGSGPVGTTDTGPGNDGFMAGLYGRVRNESASHMWLGYGCILDGPWAVGAGHIKKYAALKIVAPNSGQVDLNYGIIQNGGGYHQLSGAVAIGVDPNDGTGADPMAALDVFGGVGGSTDILRLHYPTGETIIRVNSGGGLALGATNDAPVIGQLTVFSSGTGVVNTVLKGIAGQTADMFNVQAVAGTVMFAVKLSGELDLHDGVSLKQVTFGDNDSAGAGFRWLRIANA